MTAWVPELQRAALLIGIDAYAGVPRLENAVNDVADLAALLQARHGYRRHDLMLLTDGEATAAAIEAALRSLAARVSEAHQLLFYFAGHGLATSRPGEPLNGYLLPVGAVRSDPGTYLAMERVLDLLGELSCRHRLVVLDCCFAGAFARPGHRDLAPLDAEPALGPIYRRWIRRPSFQLLASAAHDELATDRLAPRVTASRAAPASTHSPFAQALLDALAGAADRNRDGVITARDLAGYLDDAFQRLEISKAVVQTPSLSPLPGHQLGDFVFLMAEPILAEPGPLTGDANPYRGLEPFQPRHRAYFFGRQHLVDELRARVERDLLTVVLGPSGIGKSSLVQAGLLPALGEAWRVVGPVRPGPRPQAALEAAWARAGDDDGRPVCLVVDALEELVTMCRDAGARASFLGTIGAAAGERVHVVLVVRSDYEAHFAGGAGAWLEHEGRWWAARFFVPAMHREELRACIEGPAARHFLLFDPAVRRAGKPLVETILDEVDGMPGSLPLLSLALSEMFLAFVEHWRDDRTLDWSEYDAIGGVVGSIERTAEAVLSPPGSASEPDRALADTALRVVLRMVAIEGGELARRQVPRGDLAHDDPEEQARIDAVIEKLEARRLIVGGGRPDPAAPASWLEPAHDALIRGWPRLRRYLDGREGALLLHRRLSEATHAWTQAAEDPAALWADDRAAGLRELATLRQGEPPRRPRGLRARAARWLEELTRTGFVLAAAPAHLLNASERRFVTASLARRRRRRLGLAAAVTATIVVLSLATVLTYRQTVLAREAAGAERAARRAADAERLAAESVRARLEQRPQRAVLLGVAAVRTLVDHGAPASLEALDALYTASTGLGGRPVGHVASAIEAIACLPGRAACVSGSDDGVLRLWRTDAPSRLLWSADAHPGGVLLVTAGAGGRVVSAGRDRVVRIWAYEHDALRAVAAHAHPEVIRAARLSANARTLVTESRDGTIGIHALAADGAIVKTESLVVPTAMDAALDPSERWLAAIDGGGRVTVIDRAATPPARVVVDASRSAGTTVAFSPDGRWLAAGGLDDEAAVLDLADPRGLAGGMRKLGGHRGSVFALAFRDGGRWLATASDGNDARVWDLERPSAGGVLLAGHTGPIRQVAFLPGEPLRVATGSDDRTVRIWTLDPSDPDATTSAILRAHDGAVTGLALASEGRRLVSAGRDGALRAWDLEDRDPGRAAIVEVRRARDEVRALVLAGDRARGVSVDLWGGACSWTFDPFAGRCRASPIPSSERLRTVPCPERDEFLIAARGGRLLACTTGDAPCTLLEAAGADLVAAACGASRLAAADARGRAFIWDRRGGRAARRELSPPLPHRPQTLRLSPDERLLAGADARGRVAVWRLEDGRGEILSGHTDAVTELSFAPDGRQLVSAGHDAVARAWVVTRVPPRPVAILAGHGQSAVKLGITAAVFDPDGRFVATAGSDTTVRIWPLRAGVPWPASQVLAGHEQGIFGHGVQALAVHGRWLASGGEDGGVRLWDLTSATPALAGVTLGGHARAVRGVGFLAGGDRLVTAGDDQTVRIWPVGAARLVRAACDAAGRDLTAEERARYFGREVPGVCAGAAQITAP